MITFFEQVSDAKGNIIIQTFEFLWINNILIIYLRKTFAIINQYTYVFSIEFEIILEFKPMDENIKNKYE